MKTIVTESVANARIKKSLWQTRTSWSKYVKLCIVVVSVCVLLSCSANQSKSKVVEGSNFIIRRHENIDSLMLKIHFENYINKPLKEFMANDSLGIYKKKWVFMDYYKTYYLSGVLLKRKTKANTQIDIKIFIDEFKYQKQENFDRNWNFDLLLLEKVSGIRIISYEKRKEPVILKEYGDVYPIGRP